VTFKRKVAAYFPLARSVCILCFVILSLSCINDPTEPAVGVLALVFGGISIVSIALTPSEKA
jgi:hypothetical protein